MRNRGRSALAFLLALIVGLLPVTVIPAQAAATSYNLWVGGTEVTSENLSGTGWSYNAGTKTLTLNNYSYSGEGHCNEEDGIEQYGSIFALDKLTVELVGANRVKNTKPYDSDSPLICACYAADLTITGSGTLTADGGDYGIGIYCDTITVQNGAVTASGEYGILCGSDFIVENGAVNATAVGESCSGIDARGSVTIKNGSVTAKSTYGAGIKSLGELKIEGGTVVASSIHGYGIDANADITIKGGSITANGREYGIYAGGAFITIEDGTVIAAAANSESEDCTGIFGGSVNISGGTVTGTGDIGIGASAANVISGGDVIASGTTMGLVAAYEYYIISDGLVTKAGSSAAEAEAVSLIPLAQHESYSLLMDYFNLSEEIQWNYIPSESMSENKWVRVASHIHDFTFSASGDTVTGICNESGCALPPVDGKPTATLTVKAPTTDDGKALLEANPANSIRDFYGSLTYQTKTGSAWGAETATAPTTAGIHKANFTVGGAIASVSYGMNCITYETGLDHGSIGGSTGATCGSSVAPTITPDEGYQLDTLTVTPAADSGVSAVTVDGGTFVMPEANVTVSATFTLKSYDITKDAVQNGAVTIKNADGAEISTAKMGDTITVEVSPSLGYELETLKYGDTDITPTDGVCSFTMPAADVTVRASFAALSYSITKGTTEHGSVTVKETAKTGETVTITPQPDTGYAVGTVKAGDTEITPVNGVYSFTMPAADVTVSVTFEGLPVTATLHVTGHDGSTCMAILTNDSYEEIGSVTRNAGEEFTMLLYREDDYDYRMTAAGAREFTDEEYESYFDYEKAQGNFVSPNTVLLHVTMPGVSNGSVTITVEFAKQKNYTILYQSAVNSEPDIVACKIVRNVNNAEDVGCAFLQPGVTVGDGTTVWYLHMMTAFAPTQIAFAEGKSLSTDKQQEDFSDEIIGLDTTAATTSQDTNNWTSITGGGKYLIIGSNAKAVIASFVTDTSSVTVYRDNTLDIAETKDGVIYQLAVCILDDNGNVITPGTVTAPAAPANTDPSVQFAGWRGFQYDASGKASEKLYQANETNVPVRDNAAFNVVWEPATLKVNLNRNGGTGGSNVNSVTYGKTLTISENPTRNGFAFDGWKVSKAVTESGVNFAKNSNFNLNTPITAELSLTAKWKHVHSYPCYRITAFDALAQYHDYDSILHIALCSCGDLYLMAHEFDSNGVCACGYQKYQASNVTLNISYGQWVNNGYSELCKMSQTAKQGETVSVYAPNTWDHLEFSKWQYSTGDGGWVDLTARNYAAFVIRANVRVRALFINPVKEPQVELSARLYDDHAEVNGKTYIMDNILFHLNYKLPDNYTFVDAGIRYGDNNCISYYFPQQVIVKPDSGSKGFLGGIGAGTAGICGVLGYFSGGISLSSTYTLAKGVKKACEGGSYIDYVEREDNVLDKEMDAATLAKYMYERKPVNVEKYPPIYWDVTALTKGMSGSLATLTPLSYAQKYNQNHYIYGIGWMRYKDKNGNIRTIYTDALPASVKHIPTYAVTKSGS